MTHDEWSDEQREAMERFNEKDSSERHPHDLLPNGGQGYKRGVSEEECTSMRQEFKETDTTIKDMVGDEYDYSQTTIAEHVFDRCNHDIEEGAAESPMGPIDPDSFVTVEECREMREFYRGEGGEEITVVRDEFSNTYGQTYHHLVGRCKCEHDEPDIRSSE
jgi:hypothetical protein